MAEQTSSRTRRLLHQGHPSLRPRTIESIPIKQGDVFLVCSNVGDIEPDTDQGLYFHDMRYLSRQTLRINGQRPVQLLADLIDGGGGGTFQLSTPDIYDPAGNLSIRKETVGIRREKQLGQRFTETITIENYDQSAVTLTLELSFDADFVDMFVVRGATPGKRGTLHKPCWDTGSLTLRYDGADQHVRQTTIHFTPVPDQRHGMHLSYQVTLQPRQKQRIEIVIEVLDQSVSGLELTPNELPGAEPTNVARAHEGALGAGMQVETDNRIFNRILARSLLDLHMLAMRQYGDLFFAAGIPWYVALFGRDSLVTAIQMAAFEPRIAAETLRVLASYQGKRVDNWRDEQPGKILHELRVGEMANLHEMPQTPYYGSVDSTPLFLILMGTYCAWSGSLDLFHELHDNVMRALEWIDRFGDNDGDGFIDYQTHSKGGLRNQGWKDSGNAIVMEDGQLAKPPIALPEVQGEVYLAWSMIADLFRRDGDVQRAKELLTRAATLKQAFTKQFWLEEERYVALCRQADGRFSHSIASNPAHALWTGIVDDDHVKHVVERIMQPDMFTGWGVRTLSATDRSYNPIDYQVGSIWPHDNAFIVAGLFRTGYVEQGAKIFSGLIDAATKFDQYRLPETFAGYDRNYASAPVHYPVAASPQAWASGTIPYMLQMALGLNADGFKRTLRVQRPHLPDWLHWANVRNIQIAGCSVDLRYERAGEHTLVTVLEKVGDIHVSVEY